MGGDEMNRPNSVEERLARMKSVAPPADLEQRIKRAIPDQLPISPERDRERLRRNVRSVWRVVLAVVALLLLLLALILLMRSDTGETPTKPPAGKAELKKIETTSRHPEERGRRRISKCAECGFSPSPRILRSFAHTHPTASLRMTPM